MRFRLRMGLRLKRLPIREALSTAEVAEKAFISRPVFDLILLRFRTPELVVSWGTTGRRKLVGSCGIINAAPESMDNLYYGSTLTKLQLLFATTNK
jgi:hypothetical protein